MVSDTGARLRSSDTGARLRSSDTGARLRSSDTGARLRSSDTGARLRSDSTREALLDAAYDAVVSGDWEKTRMADVAASAGLSRQTLYNEFGTKDSLALALTLRESERFMAGVDERMRGYEGDPGSAIGEAVHWSLTIAHDNPLLKAILTSTRTTDDLLPFLTTRSEPFLMTARGRLVEGILDGWPHVDAAEASAIAETVVRLTVSHLVLPLEPPETTAQTVTKLVQRFLGQPGAAPDAGEEGADAPVELPR